MSFGTDSWSADENDYVNSACREKRKLIFQEIWKSIRSFGEAGYSGD